MVIAFMIDETDFRDPDHPVDARAGITLRRRVVRSSCYLTNSCSAPGPSGQTISPARS